MDSLRAYSEIVQNQYQTILTTYGQIKESPRFTVPSSPIRPSSFKTVVDKIDETYILLMAVVSALKRDGITSPLDLLGIQVVASQFSQEVELFISFAATFQSLNAMTVQL
jgi:hypothetical protein